MGTKRKANIKKMVEALINDDSQAAEESLHECLQSISREFILGEKIEDETSDDEKDKKKDCDCEEDDCDCDDKVTEAANDHPEGAMSRKISDDKTSKGGKSNVEKHGNSSKHLDDKIKGEAKFKRFPKGKSAEKHGNAPAELKDDFDEKDDGRDKDLGTTE